MQQLDFLILNGPNLGFIGQRQPEVYGEKGLDQLEEHLHFFLGKKMEAISLSYFQSNSEGALIDRLEQAREEGVQGIVFNAGAYTHTSLALADCLAWIGIPCVEVHLSNVMARKTEARQKSMLAGRCIGVISGFGVFSYALGVLALINHIDN